MANFRKNTYDTWQEASAAVKRLGVKDRDYYWIRYDKLDSLLPSNPRTYYPDFPGWTIFFNKVEFYPTWKRALRAAKKLNIRSMKEYKERRYEDPRLRSNPNVWYDDFIWNPYQFLKDPFFFKYSIMPLLELELDKEAVKEEALSVSEEEFSMSY